MKIALFGGSFDPPHAGHLAIVRKALQELPIDLLIVVPTFRNPFKSGFTAPPHLRLRWLRHAVRHKRVRICDYEVRRAEPTYTIETVEYLRRRYRPKKIYLIVGGDNLPQITKWKNYRRLRKLVEVVVATRKGFRIPKKYRTLAIREPISSTRLRQDPKRRFLPPLIARQIRSFYLKAPAKTPRSGSAGDRRRS